MEAAAAAGMGVAPAVAGLVAALLVAAGTCGHREGWGS